MTTMTENTDLIARTVPECVSVTPCTAARPTAERQESNNNQKRTLKIKENVLMDKNKQK